MEQRRTVPVKLDVDSTDAALLEDTVDEFLWAANYVTRHRRVQTENHPRAMTSDLRGPLVAVLAVMIVTVLRNTLKYSKTTSAILTVGFFTIIAGGYYLWKETPFPRENRAVGHNPILFIGFIMLLTALIALLSQIGVQVLSTVPTRVYTVLGVVAGVIIVGWQLVQTEESPE